MKADITRASYESTKHYVKVNAQQGKVIVDADWNEQIDIQEHLDKTVFRDLIGKDGTPIEDLGFEIAPDDKGSFTIGKGRYYVDGILCENGVKTGTNDFVDAKAQEDLPDYSKLPNSPFKDNIIVPNANGLYVVYLDVWQRHLTFLDDPDIREVALNGADTTTRTKTVWQAKTWNYKNAESANQALAKFTWWTRHIHSTGRLQARISPKLNLNRCTPSPEAGYSGEENRLYRVEIHSSGVLGESDDPKPVFKWSRENASVAAKILKVEVGTIKNEVLITIQNTGKDDWTRLGKEQWIEVSDDYHELWNIPGRIVKIDDVVDNTLENQSTLKIIDNKLATDESLLDFDPSTTTSVSYLPSNPKVRRWNTPDDKWTVHGYSKDIPASESNSKPTTTASDVNYFDLEDGVQIKFSDGTYVAGDYWLIPARTVTRSLDWPVDIVPDKTGTGKDPQITPQWLPSHMERHYAPLALLWYNKDSNALKIIFDYRDFFSAATNMLSLHYVSGDGQEVKQDSNSNILPFDLVAGVAVGGVPLTKANAAFWKPQVLFTVIKGEGILTASDSNPADVDDAGLVRCSWTLDNKNIHQQVQATLINHNGEPFGLPLIFNGHLPISFYYRSGDGQEITPANVIVYDDGEKEIVSMDQAKQEAEKNRLLHFNEVYSTADTSSTTEAEASSAPQAPAPPAERAEQADTNEKSLETQVIEAKDGRVNPIPTPNPGIPIESRPILLSVGAKMGNAALESVPAGNFFVRFTIEDTTGIGRLSNTDAGFRKADAVVSLDVPLKDGMAECAWFFVAPNAASKSIEMLPEKQQAKATLMVKSGLEIYPTQLQPIYFNATFAQPSLHYITGDGQEVKQESNDNTLPIDLMARVDAGGVPLPGNMTTLWKVKVEFKINRDGGTLDPTSSQPVTGVILDIDDYATVSCPWKLDGKNIHQMAEAALVTLKGRLISGPIVFCASLPISFYYVSGDGQPATSGSKIVLQVGATLSGGPLVGYKVKFVITSGDGTLEPNDPIPTDNDGLASCIWKINPSSFKHFELVPKYQAIAILLDPKEKPTDLPPIFFNAPFWLKTPTATSGIVKLEFQPNTDKTGPLISNPILHSTRTDIPPAIILSLLPAVNINSAEEPLDETAIDHLEDYALYNWALNPSSLTNDMNGPFPPFPRFKAVDVNTESFRILMEPPFPHQNWLWYIRWWAVAAQKKDIQDATFEPATFEPQVTILDAKTMTETKTISFGVPFMISVEDHFAKTSPVNVTLTLKNSFSNQVIQLQEKSDKTFMATIVFNKTSMVTTGLDGKQQTASYPSGLKAGDFTALYFSQMRQGFGYSTVSAKATLQAEKTGKAPSKKVPVAKSKDTITPTPINEAKEIVNMTNSQPSKTQPAP